MELVERLDDIIPQADFITMHMPLTAETKHMLNAERLAKAKKGVRIVNCARGGLIDEAALVEALKSKQVAAAALDVFEAEPLPADSPLRGLPNLILTPHLGASTAEAQEGVGIEVAEQIRAALLSGEIRNAVNMPSIDAKTLAVIGPHLALGEKLGLFLSQIAAKRCDSLNINYSGKINEVDTTPITRARAHRLPASGGRRRCECRQRARLRREPRPESHRIAREQRRRFRRTDRAHRDGRKRLGVASPARSSATRRAS